MPPAGAKELAKQALLGEMDIAKRLQVWFDAAENSDQLVYDVFVNAPGFLDLLDEEVERQGEDRKGRISRF